MAYQMANKFLLIISLDNGGEGGIRTPGTRKRTTDFESAAFDHSATSPDRAVPEYLTRRGPRVYRTEAICRRF